MRAIHVAQPTVYRYQTGRIHANCQSTAARLSLKTKPVLPVWGIVIGLATVAASDMKSQAASKTTNAAEVAARLRTRGDYGFALAVLTQARGPESRRKMDDMGDSLVAIATGLRGDDQTATATRAAAQAALMLAGMGETGIVGGERGTPYAGASDR